MSVISHCSSASTSTFWEHLKCLSDEHKRLENHVIALRLENELLHQSLNTVVDADEGELGVESKTNMPRRERQAKASLTSDDSRKRDDVCPDFRNSVVSIDQHDIIHTDSVELSLALPVVKNISFSNGDLIDFEAHDEDEEDERMPKPTVIHNAIVRLSNVTENSEDLCGVANPEQRWAKLVNLVISTFGRLRFWPLPCWSPSTHRAKDRKYMMRAVSRCLGTQVQVRDQIISEWNGSNANRSFGFRMSVQSMPSERSDSSISHTIRGCIAIIHPLSRFRITWSILGMLCVFYDVIALSMTVFEPQEGEMVKVLEWVMRFYWFLDILVSLRTGFYVKSKYEDRSLPIAKRYASTWLVIDVVALFPDTIVEILDSGSTEGGSSHSAVKWLLLFRVMRLVRLAKFAVILNNIIESVNSITIVLVFHLLKYLVLIVAWVHACGCAWYAIAKHADDSWLRDANIETFQLPRIYFISIQFALSQLQGNTDIFPARNAKERAFNVAVVFCSIFIMAIFISYVTNVLLSIQATRERKARQMRALQEYLHMHQVSADVSESVRKYVEEKLRIEKKMHLDEEDVTGCLPRSLRRVLLVEVRGPMINERNLVFAALQRNLPSCFEKICCDMLISFFVDPDTYVFSFGEDARKTYFNVAGEIVYDHINNLPLTELIYYIGEKRKDHNHFAVDISEESMQKLSQLGPVEKHDGSTMLKLERASSKEELAPTAAELRNPNHASYTPASSLESLERGLLRERLHAHGNLIHSMVVENAQPICEAALWTYWGHMGDLKTVSHAAFLTLPAEAFSMLAEHEGRLRAFCTAHAVRFCRILNSAEVPSSDLLTSKHVLKVLKQFGEMDTTLSNLNSRRPTAGPMRFSSSQPLEPDASWVYARSFFNRFQSKKERKSSVRFSARTSFSDDS